MQIRQLHQVAVHARDLGEAVAFYREVLGLPFIAQYDPPGLAFFDLNGVRLLLEHGAPAGALYLSVDSVQAAYEELGARGIVFRGPPQLVHRDTDGIFGDPGGEEWMAFFTDPSGNLLALVTRRQAREPGVTTTRRDGT
jgi:methylmalonyl-CoA/ethylmalonyl-CoA epimerase